MRHTIESFLKKNNFNNALSVIISLDLDNTLVVRKKGSNYVNKKILELIQNLTKSGKIIFVPNTGRELVGFSSFCKEVASFRNAVLGSGSLVVVMVKSILIKKVCSVKICLMLFIKQSRVAFCLLLICLMLEEERFFTMKKCQSIRICYFPRIQVNGFMAISLPLIPYILPN